MKKKAKKKDNTETALQARRDQLVSDLTAQIERLRKMNQTACATQVERKLKRIKRRWAA